MSMAGLDMGVSFITCVATAGAHEGRRVLLTPWLAVMPTSPRSAR